MPLNLSVKNVPDTIAMALRVRAEQNHRSLQGELMAILEHAVAGSTAEPARAERLAQMPPQPARFHHKLTIDEVAAGATKLFPQGTSSSDAFIRAMRDGRYGDEWARSGHHAQPD